MKTRYDKSAFTLIELVIAMAIFALIATAMSDSFIQAIRQDSKTNLNRQVLEDARFILEVIEREIKSGTVDYDEYFNQNVVLDVNTTSPTLLPHTGQIPTPQNIQNIVTESTIGQNYGRYYSSFYHAGSDGQLGFACNDRATRNQNPCPGTSGQILRNTIDRNTGQNPFSGKGALTIDRENAFCGEIFYDTNAPIPGTRFGQCAQPFRNQAQRILFLISQDGSQKTVLGRERVGLDASGETFALSLLRMTGIDRNGDGVFDAFVCHPDFQCRSGYDVPANPNANANTSRLNECASGNTTNEAPRSFASELFPPTIPAPGPASICEDAQIGFNKDFVPVSPLRVAVTDLRFYISPSENPHYAFSEDGEQMQPTVTIQLTVDLSPNYNSTKDFEPVTIVKSVVAGATNPVPAPVAVQP